MATDKQCNFDGCGKKLMARGLCAGHYRQISEGRPLATLTRHSLTAGMSAEARFWFYVDKSGDCWEWTGTKKESGYGLLRFDGRLRAAHRISWELANGPIPPGMDIDHKCHNPSCVRHSHLHPVSTKQNAENRQGAQRNSKSGIRGVSMVRGVWLASVRHHGRNISVGHFATAAEAEAAAIAKRNQLFTNNILDRRSS